MMFNIRLEQQTRLGEVDYYQHLTINTHHMTLRDLFEQHIETFCLLIQDKLGQNKNFHAAYESQLNPLVSKSLKNTLTELSDPKLQLKKTIELFQKNRFLVLVDDHQITDLDKPFPLAEHSTIQFIKLVPLIGG